MTPWTAAPQASLSITNSRSPPKPMSIMSVMSSNYLILCCPLLLLLSILPSIRVFSSESVLCMKWPKYWSFSFSIIPSKEHSLSLLQKSDKVCFEENQFSSVTQSCPTLCNPMNHSMPGPLSITNSRSLPKLMSIELVMPSSHLILCHPLLLLPPIPPSIRVFSSESALHMRLPKYWSISFSISPSNEHPELISFRMD